MEVCQRTQIDLPDESRIMRILWKGLCVNIPQADTCIHVFCSTIHSSQAIELSLVPVNEWIRKMWCIYTWVCVQLSRRKTDTTEDHRIEQNESDSERQMSHISSHFREFIKTCSITYVHMQNSSLVS